MSGLRGVFAGALALIALETVLSTTGAADRTAGLLSDVSRLIARMLDPNIPAIPDLTGSSSSAPTSAAVYTAPPADQAPVVAPPPANNKPKAPKATVAI